MTQLELDNETVLAETLEKPQVLSSLISQKLATNPRTLKRTLEFWFHTM